MFYLLALSLHLAKFADEAEFLAHMDINRDGFISKPESVFNLILVMHFKSMDLDKDGKISLAELQQSELFKAEQADSHKQN